MLKQIKQVELFHTTFGHPAADSLTDLTPQRAAFRHRILQEEVEELKEALLNRDMVETADGITDCIWILIGTAIECGLQPIIEKCFDEVFRSNMSKLDASGKPIYREDGKIMKSDLYEKPDLQKIFTEQIFAV